MRRRAFLATTAAVLTAGCSSGSSNSVPEAPEEVTPEGTRITVSIRGTGKSQKLEYCDHGSDGTEIARPDRGAWLEVRYRVENESQHSIPTDDVDNVQVLIGGEKYGPTPPPFTRGQLESGNGVSDPFYRTHGREDNVLSGSVFMQNALFDVPDHEWGNYLLAWEFDGKEYLLT